MLCKECKTKPMVRGIKSIKCFRCGSDTIINSNFTDICIDCSNQLNVCQCCGEQIKDGKDMAIVPIKKLGFGFINASKNALRKLEELDETMSNIGKSDIWTCQTIYFEEKENKVSQNDLTVARNTYDELMKINEVLLYSNPLLVKDDVNDKAGYITDAVIYHIQRVLGIETGEDDSFNVILECIDDEDCFDDMLFELQRALGIEVEDENR